MSSPPEKRLLPRVTVSHEIFRDDKSGKLFSVVDLSKSGMAIRINDREDLYAFAVGAELAGVLNLRREKLPIVARVRHLGLDQVGVEFETLAPETERALNRVLDPHTLGEDLRPVPTEDGSFLYASEGGTEFLLEREENGAFRRLVILVLGYLVQWDARTGLRTGKVKSSFEESRVLGVTRMENMLFHEDAAIDPQKLSVAKTLISSSNLSEDIKKFCFRRLEGASA